ncbi:glycosyltransferase family 1 protein [Aurantimonas sp. A2-1-M11]|uniref:glycosyltransferase family 4 protein n=1 Tax=Aurantimonas sp. A2-1-M11 TaxID=3113712 RepID=UPI002F950B10
MPRHWTINGRFLAQPMSGVQRYAREILREFDLLLSERIDIARNLEVELVLPPDAGDAPALTAIGTRKAGRLRGHAWEQATLPRHVRGGLVSLCNTGPLAVGRQILCIHDLNTRTFPESYSRSFRWAYGVLLPALGRTVATVATVSNYSAGQISSFGIFPEDKILVAPNGHEHAAGWKPAHSAATLGAASRDTIVVLGSSIPHKNVALILSMADRLSTAGLRLAVVGDLDSRVFNSAGIAAQAGNVIRLGRLTDSELAALLRDSLCLAFPSFVEGFGLPPLEAMALGCPVVVSDRASLPEICGNAALYAAPDDPDAWFERLVRLRHDPRLRIQMIAGGRARLALFRWRSSAERYLEVMARADGLSMSAAAANKAADYAVA